MESSAQSFVIANRISRHLPLVDILVHAQVEFQE